MHNEIKKKLAKLCRRQLKEEGKTITRFLRGLDSNPFPISKSSIEKLIYKNRLSVKQIIILAEHFKYKVRLILKKL